MIGGLDGIPIDTNMQAPSATNIDEGQLSRWLFGESPALRHLASELSIGWGSRVAFEVPTIKLVPGARGPGNIDVLVFNSQAPEQTLAIELKRVKVTPNSFATELPGKLAGLEHGVEQANLLGKLGFHRVYLLIAIVTDGRWRSEYNFFGRGPTPELLQAIARFPGRDQLSPAVGLAFVEVTQPTDKEVTWAGSTGAWVEQRAQEIDQPVTLTAAVAELFT
jgi:hypothetical protein